MFQNCTTATKATFRHGLMASIALLFLIGIECATQSSSLCDGPDTNDALVLVSRAEKFALQGKTKASQACLDQATLSQPNEPSAIAAIARGYMEHKLWKSAHLVWLRLKKMQPTSRMVQLCLMDVESKMGHDNIIATNNMNEIGRLVQGAVGDGNNNDSKMDATSTNNSDDGLDATFVALEAGCATSLGNSMLNADQLGMARSLFSLSVFIDKSLLDSWEGLGVACGLMNQHDCAANAWATAASLKSNDAYYLHNLGVALEKSGNTVNALKSFQEAAALEPRVVRHLLAVGRNTLLLGDVIKADAVYSQAYVLAPSDGDVTAAYAVTSKALGELATARSLFEKSLKAHPNDVRTIFNLADLLFHHLGAGQYQEKAISLLVRAAGICVSMGFKNGRMIHGRRDSDNEDLEACATATIALSSFRLAACDWSSVQQDVSTLMKAVIPIGKFYPPALHPFQTLTSPTMPIDRVVEIATNHTAFVASSVSQLLNAALESAFHKRQPRVVRVPVDGDDRSDKRPRTRLRVGYVAAEFSASAAKRDLFSLFSQHTKSADVYCYSTVALQSSDVADAKSTCHQYVDLGNVSFVDAAGQIASDDVDVVVDHTSWLRGNKFGALLLLPKSIPVISHKGYAGPVGNGSVGWQTSDIIAFPPEFAQSETVKRMYVGGGHSYFHAGHAEAHSDAPKRGEALRNNPPKRSEFPKAGLWFVMACYNQHYKIDADVFAMWLSVLKKTKRVSLWMQAHQDLPTRNLRAAAKSAKVDKASLVMTPRTNGHAHLEQKARADVFVDTPLYNAHGTAADALWVHTPLLTTPGLHAASRAGASIVSSLGTAASASVVRDRDDYRELLQRLATSKPALQKLRKSVADAASSVRGVFDVKSYCSRWETGLRLIVETNALDLHMHIVVAHGFHVT